MSQLNQIKVSEVLALLNAGKSRKEIAEHFGISQKACKDVLFQHPSLKGKKAKKQPDFEIVDDTQEPADTTENKKEEDGSPISNDIIVGHGDEDLVDKEDVRQDPASENKEIPNGPGPDGFPVVASDEVSDKDSWS